MSQRITKIYHVMRWTKDKKEHSRTYAVLADEHGNLMEAMGYGDEYKEGQPVEAFFNHEWDYYQFKAKGGGK